MSSADLLLEFVVASVWRFNRLFDFSMHNCHDSFPLLAMTYVSLNVSRFFSTHIFFTFDLMPFIRSKYDADVWSESKRRIVFLFTDSAPAADSQVHTPIIISCIYNVHYLEVARKHHSRIKYEYVYAWKFVPVFAFLGAVNFWFTCSSIFIYSYVAYYRTVPLAHSLHLRVITHESTEHYLPARIVNVKFAWQSPHQKWRQLSYRVIIKRLENPKLESGSRWSPFPDF